MKMFPLTDFFTSILAFSSPLQSAPEGHFLTATTGYYFHNRGQLLESPLAPGRAADFFNWRADFLLQKLKESNQVLIISQNLTVRANYDQISAKASASRGHRLESEFMHRARIGFFCFVFHSVKINTYPK